jgi:hypothetical protein
LPLYYRTWLLFMDILNVVWEPILIKLLLRFSW